MAKAITQLISRHKRILYLLPLLASGALLFSRSAHPEEISHIGVNQKVLVICVKYSDVATTRLASASDWVTLLGAETNTFFNRATFDQTNFSFETTTGPGAPPDGWHSLGYASTSAEFFKTCQDAINLADPFADFSQYNRVLVITNLKGFGGSGGGPWWWKVNEGVEATFDEGGMSVSKRLMTMAIVNEWEAHSFGNPFDEAASVAAHELGHQLGLPTHYADLRWFPGLPRDVITPWDIMGLSPTLSHFIGWAKTERKWIPSGPRIETIGPPTGSSIDTTITLQPLEASTMGVQIIRIPITPVTPGAPFFGYFIENRRMIYGDDLDERLPSSGVLLSLIDESKETILKCVVLEDQGMPGDPGQAPLDVGGVFTDPARNLTVTVLKQTGDTYDVRIQYLLPPEANPDPMITPWGAPPWETPDIWIDSEKNGFDVYKYTDGSGNPEGNGDDAWVNHDNRVYVRVRNIGPGVATNVRVQVFANSPPGMGDAGPDYAHLGTIIFASIPGGGVAQGFVTWKPTVGAHTCLKAEITNIPEELSATNNVARENVSAFDSREKFGRGTVGGGFEPVGLPITVFNPLRNTAMPIHLHVRDIPRGWTVSVNPTDSVLPPGGNGSVRFLVFPSDDRQYRPGFIGKPKIEAQAAFGDTFIPIGGVDLWAHLTSPTKLSCGVTGRRLAPQNIPNCLFGQSAIVRGNLTPANANAIIAVEFTLGRNRRILFARTDANGEYRVRFVPPFVGLWRIQAFFSGDLVQAAADSQICLLRVTNN